MCACAYITQHRNLAIQHDVVSIFLFLVSTWKAMTYYSCLTSRRRIGAYVANPAKVQIQSLGHSFWLMHVECVMEKPHH